MPAYQRYQKDIKSNALKLESGKRIMKNANRRKAVTFLGLIALVAVFLVIAGCSSSKGAGITDAGKIKVTVFKSSSCGCCVGYAAELDKQGFDVSTVETANMASIKQQYNIPKSMESCHTTIMGDYFIEGHMPIEAIEKLLEEKPQIDGIALPNMPAGSPGMPGTKTGKFKIYAVSDGEFSEFMMV